MEDTRNPSGSPDNLSKERSMLRDGRHGANPDQRPAGPSAASNPGMGEPAAPLPPGVRSSDPNAWSTSPKVAGSFRFDFANEPDKDSWANRKDLSK